MIWFFFVFKKTPVELENGVSSGFVPDLNAGDSFFEMKYVRA